MTFRKADLDLAIGKLSMCQFFPSEPVARAAVATLLARMCPDKDALDWLVDQFTDRIGTWHGPVELRGVLCQRFRPADGVEANSSLPGYRPEDSEERHYSRHLQLKGGGWTNVEEGPRELKSQERRLLGAVAKDWPNQLGRTN